MTRSRFLVSALVGAALLIGPSLAVAEDATAPAGDDPVVAVVNGQELHQSDVLRSAKDLPPQMQAQISMLFPALIQRLVDLTLLSQAARDQGLADDKRVKELVAEAETDAVRRVYLEDKIDAAMTDEKLQEAYKQYLAENPAGEEVKARHILLKDKESAEKIIDQLNKGADFEKLAKENSTGPSAAQGGDLGWFAKDQMVEPFSKAAFELKKGEYTKAPVKTQFGWHVIKVEDRRTKAAPSFAEVESKLREQLARKVIDDEVQALRKTAKIDIKQQAAAPGTAAPDAAAPATGGEAPADGTQPKAQ
ncbi:peptidyl-prolyl cis-trans isomerase C [Tistlia consotensis]|uniref:Parvulin-like PPIase n=1 Tax=Tistlia consotensis USBA 355 TaxID=560819 RepID=A0A1Y6BY60_9PROT|nr:peptidylprolyl isomerase [Tistlia consotensis]SMF33636.1 peptidyl-prolyl cis-trans isomerase C [Tistlia consotensis USBA 355]SNR69979.1 peptidyl-prolyl cis-trans isomerase C [Tistlia consotensis]